jgi:AmmeMemoRadiSam system protein B
MKEGLWKTPFGEVAISNKVAEKILNKSSLVEYDVIPHENEHSIEVQLPFLQYRFGNDFKIVPILVSNKFNDKDFVEQCKKLGKAIAHSVMSEKEKWIIIATSDFSQGSKKDVDKKDKSIISSLKSLKEERFFNAINKSSSRICGYGAILTTLAAAKEMKAKKSRLLKYVNSMEVLKDPNTVTGYASILVY